jgi:hypothetical protein
MSNNETVMLCLPEGHSGEFKYDPVQTQKMFLASIDKQVQELIEDNDITKAQAAQLGAQAVLTVIDNGVAGMPRFSLRTLEPDDGSDTEHDYRADIAGNLSQNWLNSTVREEGRKLLIQATEEWMQRCSELIGSDNNEGN